jgi:hypothetical protein
MASLISTIEHLKLGNITAHDLKKCLLINLQKATLGDPSMILEKVLDSSVDPILPRDQLLVVKLVRKNIWILLQHKDVIDVDICFFKSFYRKFDTNQVLTLNSWEFLVKIMENFNCCKKTPTSIVANNITKLYIEFLICQMD